MSDEIMIFCLTVCIIFLAGIVIYQQFAFHTGTKAKLREISCKLVNVKSKCEKSQKYFIRPR